MEVVAVLLIIGALWVGYKVGHNAGRTELLDAQSRSIGIALASDSDFYRKTRLHGSFLLEGHEYRSPSNFVLVSWSELERRIEAPAPQDESDEPIPLPLDVAPQTEVALRPSPQLAEIIGAADISATEAVKKVWAYVKAQGLRDVGTGAQVNCNNSLKAITGRDWCTPFELTKHIRDHLR